MTRMLVTCAVVLLTTAAAANDWQAVNPLPTQADLEGVAVLANGRQIAVGEFGTILERQADDPWSIVSSGTDVDLVAVAGSSDLAVAVGEDGTVMASEAPGLWRSQPPLSGADLVAVAAGPLGFVAVGTGGTVAFSRAGLAWTVTEFGGGTLRGVVWLTDRWLVVGDGGRVLWSADGVNWMPEPAASFSRPTVVDTGAGLVVVWDAEGDGWVSSDGMSWTRADLMDAATAVTHCWGRFVVTSDAFSGASSRDGIHWNRLWSDSYGPGLRDLACAGERVIGVGRGGLISEAGETFVWRGLTGFGGVDLVSAAAGPSGVVVGGGRIIELSNDYCGVYPYGYGSVLTSTDGVAWREADRAEISDRLVGTVGAGNGGFLVAATEFDHCFGGRTDLFLSPDGLAWERVWDVAGWVNAVEWDGSRWLVLADSDLGSSADGRTWIFRELPWQARRMADLATGDGRLVVVGIDGQMAWSDDGAVWTRIAPPTSVDLWSVAWAGGRFVAVGNAGTILTGTNGVNWQTVASGTSRALQSVRAVAGGFAAVGAGGVLMTSADGLAWEMEIVPPGHDLIDLVEPEGRLIVVGRDGLISREGGSTTGSAPDAAFTWRPVEPSPGESVRFLDRSLGEVDGYQWSFGDGTGGDGPTEDHVFSAESRYTVELTVTGPDGVDAVSAVVEVADPCEEVEAPILAPPEINPDTGAVTLRWSDPGASNYSLWVRPTEAVGHWITENLDVLEHTFELDWTVSRTWLADVRARRACDSGSISSPRSNPQLIVLEPRADAPGATRLLIPAAAHAPGIGETQWSTDLVVFNSNPQAATVGVGLSGGDPAALSLHLRAGETTVVEDVVGELTPNDAVGSLVLSSDLPLVASSRTVTTTAAGGFGQLIPAYEPATLTGGTKRLLGLVRDNAFRTNLGFASASTAPVTARTSFISSDGGFIGELLDLLPPGGFLQRTDVLGGNAPLDGAHASINLDPTVAAVAAYASVVDNGTGDPVYRAPARPPGGWRLSIGPRLSVVGIAGEIVPCGEGAVAAGRGGMALTENLRQWLPRSFDGEVRFRFLAGNGDQVISYGPTRLFVSDDCGETWTRRSVEGAESIWDAAWSGVRWVAVAGGATVMTSRDGLNWQTHNGVLPGTLIRIVRGESEVAAVGGEFFARSADGVEWQSSQVATGAYLDGVAAGPVGYVVASPQYGTRGLWFSSDGEAWTKVSDVYGSPVWTGDRFLATTVENDWDNEAGFSESFDGITWAPVAVPGFPQTDAVLRAFGDGRVAILGWSGELGWLVNGNDDLLVPAVASLPGVESARWRSELILTETAGTASTCRIDLLERGRENSNPTSVVRELDPGATLVIADAVGDLFGIERAGAMRIACSPATVAGASRTFTTVDAGSYGQGVAVGGLEEAIHSFEAAVLSALIESPDPDAGRRSNLGLVSLCRQPMTVDVDFLGTGGEVIVSRSYDLRPFEAMQRNRVLAGVGADDGEPVTLALTSATPGCVFAAWASLVDNGTDDPVFLQALPVGSSEVIARPGGLELDNGQAVVIDRLTEAEGTATLPPGELDLAVDGSGALGGADRPLQVLCLWRRIDGQVRAEVLRTGETATGILGSEPFWCVVPDLGTCADNTGWVRLELSGPSGNRVFELDNEANCVVVSTLAGARPLDGDGGGNWNCVTSGDLGTADFPPQALVIYNDIRGASPVQRAVVMRHGSSLEDVSDAGPAYVVVVDWDTAEDNRGWTWIER